MAVDISGMPDPSKIGLKADISGMPAPDEIGLKPPTNSMDFTGKESPEEEEVKANVGAGEAVASLATGGLASVPAGIDYLARSAVHGTGALIGYAVAGGDPEKSQKITDWLGRKHQEDRESFDDIANFWTYSPRTQQGQAVAALPGEAIHAGLHAALPDNAAQTVEEAGGDILRGLAAVPTVKAIPRIPGAIRGARAAQAAETATAAAAKAAPTATPSTHVTAEQLRSQPNPIPPPHVEDASTSPATLAVQKPKITPRAGESAQEAASRQGILPAASQEATGAANATPPATTVAPSGRPPLQQMTDPAAGLFDEEMARLSGNTKPQPAPAAAAQRGSIFANRQAGAARIFHPPQEEGPQFSVKAADADQAARHDTLAEVNQLGGGGLTHVRRGAVTGDWEETGNEHQTSKMPDAPGQLLRDQIAAEHQTLHNAAQNAHDATGSEALNNVDRDTMEQRGRVVRGAVHAIEDHFNRAANGMYATARAQMGDRPMPSMPRVQQILSDTSHDTNPTAGSLRRAAQAKLQQLWSVGDTRGNVKTAPGTVGAAERFHEFLNEAYHNDSSGLIRKLKNATDMDVAERAGGNDMYQAARNVIQHRETMLEPDGVNELRHPKDRNKIDHDVGLDEVMDHVTNQDSEHFEHFMNVLRAGAHLSPEVAEKAAAAIREIQGHMVAKMHAAARGEAGAWNANNFYKAGNRFSTNLPHAFRDNPSVLANLQTINRAGNILKMDKAYPGAVAQAAKVGLIPSLAQKAIKGTKLVGELGGVAHGNVVMAAGAHLGGKALEAGVNRLTARGRLATARESLTPLGAKMGNKERGAVGDLSQREAIEHDQGSLSAGTIEHSYRPPNDAGALRVTETPGLGVRQVTEARVNPEVRGQGWGTRMLQRAADDAHAAGHVLHSDHNVSTGQIGAYKNLAQLGYKVTEKGNTKHPGSWEAWGNHVFEVRPKDGGPGKFQRGSVPVTRNVGTSAGGADILRQPEPEGGGSMVNIGLHQGTQGEPGFRKMSKQEAVAALKQAGVAVGKTSIHTPEGGEPTLVASISRPMTDEEAHGVASKLRQTAIAQRDAEGNGSMHGPGVNSVEANAQGWDQYNPDYFRMHDGRTAGEHATEFNPEELEKENFTPHESQTVKNPVRNAYPGIYHDPKEIMSRVKTAAEDPILKQLFGVTRKDLHDDAVGRMDTEQDYKPPGVKEGGKARGAASAKGVMTDENAERLRNVISAFKDHDLNAYHGMVGWYEMQRLYDKVVEHVGAKAAPAVYARLNHLMGMSSAGSDVATEINRGTGANMMASKGEFSKFQKFGGQAEGARGKNFPPELEDVKGHAYHSTAQAPAMAQYLKSGEMQMQSPKVPTYIRSTAAQGQGFQNKILVGDSHWSRGVGLSDTRTAGERVNKQGQTVKTYAKSVSNPELADLHPWYREHVAHKSGLPATSAQAVQWGALSAETGVDTAIGAPKLELFAQQVAKAAKRLKVSPEEALRRIIKGMAHAG